MRIKIVRAKTSANKTYNFQAQTSVKVKCFRLTTKQFFMITDLVKPFLFLLILGLFSCGKKGPSQDETLTEQQDATPVLVANNQPEDTAISAASDKEPKSSAEELAAPKPVEINQKPVPAKEKKSTEPKEAVEPIKVVKEEASPIVAQEEQQPKIKEAPVPPKKEETVKETGASHEAWDALLKKFVSADGKVNYKGFKSSEGDLDAYLDHLDKHPVKADWSKADKMAYWINAYNAFTVKLIVDNYPVNSIMDLHGGKPWDVKWIKLGDQTYSLNNIENDILRPKYKDARIHFAVNCAAQSCPPLLNRAWQASTLNSTFDQQAKKFINNPKFNKISANNAQVSKIFEWYASDFGNLIDYLNKYSNTTIQASAKVSYLEYDWALNQ